MLFQLRCFRTLTHVFTRQQIEALRRETVNMLKNTFQLSEQ